MPVLEHLNLRLHNLNHLAHIKWDSDTADNYDFFVWHLGTDPYSAFPNIPAFTTLRHPINRVISHFFFGLDYFYFHKDYTNIDDIETLFNIWLTDDAFKLSTHNHQARFLTTGMNELPTFPRPKTFPDKETSDRIMLGFDIKDSPYTFEDAKKRLDSMVVSGVIEKLGDFNSRFIDYFKTEYGVKFNNLEEKKEHVNQQSQEWAPTLSKKYGDRILELNQIDLALWEYLYNK